jgi:D-glycero-alpha-D-manno-heptose-7-phosphate kinase
VIVCARAPLRLSFAGGGTDLPPYPDECGGLVLNATIHRYAYATLRPHPEPTLRVRSVDFDRVLHLELGRSQSYDGELDLAKACVNRLLLDGDHAGLDLYLETEAPPGSGLGGSSALVAAMIGAMAEWRQLRLSKYELAHLAWQVERQDLGVPGGMQDQYAAVFGGFNYIEFDAGNRVIVNPLRLEPWIVDELQYHLLLVYLGSRASAAIIESQIAGYVKRDPNVVEAMGRMKTLTVDAKNALVTGRLDDLGALLHEDWLEKKRTSRGVSNSRIDELYEEARRLGALGGKVSGAGGGGFMLLYCPVDHKAAIRERMGQLGGVVSPVSFEPQGMTTWAHA